jgi:hypothetical protein
MLDVFWQLFLSGLSNDFGLTVGTNLILAIAQKIRYAKEAKVLIYRRRR